MTIDVLDGHEEMAINKSLDNEFYQRVLDVLALEERKYATMSIQEIKEKIYLANVRLT